MTIQGFIPGLQVLFCSINKNDLSTICQCYIFSPLLLMLYNVYKNKPGLVTTLVLASTYKKIAVHFYSDLLAAWVCQYNTEKTAKLYCLNVTLGNAYSQPAQLILAK